MAAVANSTAPPATTAVAAAATTASPPWSQIVRGPEPEPEPEPKPEPKPKHDVTAPASDVTAAENGESNAAGGRKSSAWNKKPMTKASSSEGDAAESGGAAVVMGAEMWPSLAECTKVSPKLTSLSSPSSSLETSINLPSLPPPVTRIDTASTATAQSSVPSPSSISHRQTVSSPNHHMTSNHVRPTRQKFTKRDGGNSSLANGGPSHQSSQLPGDGAHHHPNQGSAKPNTGGSFESSGRDHVQNHSYREPGQRNSSGEHYHHRNSFRKGNGGPHSRGDGSHQNYGGRRNDQERGNHDLNHQRSFNGRDGSMQPRGFPRGFVRPPPMAPNMIYPTVPPFPNPMIPVFPVMPVLGPLGPVFVHGPGLELYPELLKQINYYFSNENLVRDTYLRNAMDDNGWVHVDFIADFNRVKYLTNDTYLILEAVRPSTVVEVQGDKIRKRDDWKRWVLPPSLRFPPASGSQSPNHQAVSAVTDRIQSVSVDEKVNYTSTVRGQGDGSASMSQASSGSSDSASKVSLNEANTAGS
ncbi:hypothetical protein vseg_015525 [Gypsophila vaccaria]